MIKKVIFFNFLHYGDIHVSRGLVREISNICYQRNISCEYYFNGYSKLLNDIPNVLFIKHKYSLNQNTPSFIRDNTLFINAWYSGNRDIFLKYSVSFDTLYLSFKEVCKLLDIDLESIDRLSLFPSINYEKFQIENAKNWLSKNNRKRIFISNGPVLSGQCNNFPMFSIINKLSEQYKDIDFLISNKENGINNRENIFLTNNIIQKDENDLNENSYLASNCSIIVGRYSGTYTFAITRENYFDKPKTFITFTHLDTTWTYSFTDKPKANILFFNENEENKVYKLISDNIFRNL